MASLTALLITALTVLRRMFSMSRELYLTRIRDAVQGHKSALDLNRESKGLWIKAWPLITVLLIMTVASPALVPYMLITSLYLAPPCNVVAWMNLAALMALALVEVYVIARIDCAVWIR